LTLANYDVFPKEKKIEDDEDDEDETDEKPKKENNKEEKHDFDYLLSMKIWNMTREKSEKFQQKLLLNQEKLATLKCTSIENMWLNDLDIFIEKYKEHFAIEIETVPIKKSKKTKVFRVPKTTDQIPIKYNPEGFKGTIVKSLESDKKQKTKSQKVKIGEKNIKMEKSKKVKLGESVKLEESEKKVKLEQSVKLEKKVKLEQSVKLEKSKKSETPKRKIEVAKEKKEKKEKKHKKLKIEGN
jgi:DNA topoisomerase-2